MSTVGTSRETPLPSAAPSALSTEILSTEIEDLEALIALDDDEVETAVIPVLAYVAALPMPPAAQPTKVTEPQSREVRTIVLPAAIPAARHPLPAPAAPETTVDADDEDTAVIPALAADAPAASSDASPEVPASSASQRTRHRHASPESLAAIRRNTIAVASLSVAIVLLGATIAYLGGWLAAGGFLLTVTALLVTRYFVNRRYSPRHTRYGARHA